MEKSSTVVLAVQLAVIVIPPSKSTRGHVPQKKRILLEHQKMPAWAHSSKSTAAASSSVLPEMTSIKNEGNGIAGYLATAMERRLLVLETGIAPDDHQVFTDVEDMGDDRNKDTFKWDLSITDALLRDCSKLEGYKTGESQNVSVNLQACSVFLIWPNSVIAVAKELDHEKERSCEKQEGTSSVPEGKLVQGTGLTRTFSWALSSCCTAGNVGPTVCKEKNHGTQKTEVPLSENRRMLECSTILASVCFFGFFLMLNWTEIYICHVPVF